MNWDWIDIIPIVGLTILSVFILYKIVIWFVNKADEVGFKNTLYLSVIIILFLAILIFGMVIDTLNYEEDRIFSFVMVLIYYNVWKYFYMKKNEYGVGDRYNSYDFGSTNSLENAIQNYYSKEYSKSVLEKIENATDDDYYNLITSIRRNFYTLALKDLFYALFIIVIIIIPGILDNNAWISILIFLFGYSIWDSTINK